MSMQNIQGLADAAAHDPQLREALEKATDVQGLIAAASAQGYPFTEEELRAAIRPTVGSSQELSDDDLEKVSGGGAGWSVDPGLFELPAVQNLQGILIAL